MNLGPSKFVLSLELRIFDPKALYHRVIRVILGLDFFVLRWDTWDPWSYFCLGILEILYLHYAICLSDLVDLGF